MEREEEMSIEEALSTPEAQLEYLEHEILLLMDRRRELIIEIAKQEFKKHVH